MTEPTTEEQYAEGRECTCHLSPPCSFCVAMDEEEVEAWCDDGYEGLERLWATRIKGKHDEQAL